MKNITLSASQDDIENARRNAARRGTTINKEFRNWLKTQASDSTSQVNYFCKFMENTDALAGHHLSRDELNER